MAHLIDKDALVAEIENKINKIDLNSIENWHYRLQREHNIEVMKNIISIIDTLEVKGVDLEKEIELVKGDYEQVDVAWNNDFDFIAKDFFELGLKAQKGE